MILVARLDLLDALWQHAEMQRGREVCGVLIGTWGATVEVTDALPGENLLSAPDRFLLDAASLLAADDVALARGAAIVGFYHSHPEQFPVPSALDRQDAWTGHLYLIIGTAHGRARATCGWTFDVERRIHPVLLHILGM